MDIKKKFNEDKSINLDTSIKISICTLISFLNNYLFWHQLLLFSIQALSIPILLISIKT